MASSDRRYGRGQNRMSDVTQTANTYNSVENGVDSTLAGPSNSNSSTPRHPPHLRGKQIGLYYANLKRRNSQRTEDGENELKPLETISFSPDLQTKLQHYLNEIRPDEGISNENSTFLKQFQSTVNGNIIENLANYELTEVLRSDPELDRKLSEEFHMKQTTNDVYNDMLKFRLKLPAYKMAGDLVELIDANQVVVISGETGCGKTTQVAQFVLDHFLSTNRGSLCRIVCTQPRRISVIAVAERVSKERGESLGQSVGYQIRLENKLPKNPVGSILFCTTGILLKQMETDPGLGHYSHLILDEIHERDIQSDFVLALVKKILCQRKDLKVILMSATLNSEIFAKYYQTQAQIHIPGFTYPVEEFYLEDVLCKLPRFQFPPHRGPQKDDFAQTILRPNHDRWRQQYPRHIVEQLRNPNSEELSLDLIFELLKMICSNDQNQDGAILVFLTGFSDISNLLQKLERSGKFPATHYRLYGLHSVMPSAEQRQIFDRPPCGVRKIVLATNIAETSITIDDVTYVVNCGKQKMSNFDVDTNTQTLQPEWISLANAKQRRGRAGRVQSGICYHLYTRARSECLVDFQLPEILRRRLDDIILTQKMLQLGDTVDFFNSLLDTPALDTIQFSLDLLKQLNALTEDEKLTPLGYHLAKLPMAPQLGKMCLFGAIFSCLEPILSIAATLDYKDAFNVPLSREKEADLKRIELAKGLKSDHLLYDHVLNLYENCTSSSDVDQLCWDNFLNRTTLKLLVQIKHQIMTYLYEMDFVRTTNPKSPDVNRNSTNTNLIRAIIAAGLYPNCLRAKQLNRKPLLRISNRTPKKGEGPKRMGRLQFHPKSVLDKVHYFDCPLMVYYKIMRTTGTFVHDGTLINPLSVLLFSNQFRTVSKNVMDVNGLQFLTRQNGTADILCEIRNRFYAFFTMKITNPDCSGPVRILQLIIDLIQCEDNGDLQCDNLLMAV